MYYTHKISFYSLKMKKRIINHIKLTVFKKKSLLLIDYLQTLMDFCSIFVEGHFFFTYALIK